MNTALKVTAFAAGLAATFTAAYGVGHAVGPAPAQPHPAAHGGRAAHPADDAGATAHADHQVGGLQAAERGYTLSLDRTVVPAGGPTELSFRVLAPDGHPLTAYRPAHEKELHLIVASRDLTDFQHLHPVRAADGTWTAPANIAAAGDYRVFADFTPAAEADPLTLTGDLAPGRPGRLAFTVTEDGRPVTDLDPYLAAYGHLVVLRAGDLGYLHVHPDGEPGDGATAPGPEIDFTATAPSPGDYRLFLDFQHRGTVHTAAFTLTAETHQH
ncbi:hypothetical protein ABZ747_37630 [Kitasatospora cineracea]|uniref:hypothetical protein n=1 Tax=Kitasatospora cineracea TaxID=88074 RepID=UPI00340287AF